MEKFEMNCWVVGFNEIVVLYVGMMCFIRMVTAGAYLHTYVGSKYGIRIAANVLPICVTKMSFKTKS